MAGLGLSLSRERQQKAKKKKKSCFLKHLLAVLLKSTTDKWEQNIIGGRSEAINQYFLGINMQRYEVGAL